MVFDIGPSADILYVRFKTGEKVVRVAKSRDAFVEALYPTETEGIFEIEHSYVPDRESERHGINRFEIEDRVILRLLDGEERDDILKDYEPFAGFHCHCPVGEPRLHHPGCLTFRIADDREE
jgi:hypothetical protein